jgi:antitoxin component YwqK of YwqJK toxin-antitoxin module|tara:strand:- start:417 stop:713 length:297 start_codon:yes stop_codon:yes gene_type:complete
MEMIPILKFINFLLILFLFSCNGNEREHKLYYPNGDIRVSGTYVDDKAHGFWEGYYPNGQLKSAGEYFNDELVGHWMWYYEDGSIIKDSTYNYPSYYE